jgi:hypothetical protein
MENNETFQYNMHETLARETVVDESWVFGRGG